MKMRWEVRREQIWRGASSQLPHGRLKRK